MDLRQLFICRKTFEKLVSFHKDMLRRIQHFPERTALPAVYGFAGQCPIESELHINEPRHYKTNKVTVRPAKTQIRRGGCPG